MASAGKGVEASPIVVRSWYGLAPASEYLDGLFYEDPAGKTLEEIRPILTEPASAEDAIAITATRHASARYRAEVLT